MAALSMKSPFQHEDVQFVSILFTKTIGLYILIKDHHKYYSTLEIYNCTTMQWNIVLLNKLQTAAN